VTVPEWRDVGAKPNLVYERIDDLPEVDGRCWWSVEWSGGRDDLERELVLEPCPLRVTLKTLSLRLVIPWSWQVVASERQNVHAGRMTRPWLGLV
jgi:hypothetical protein